MIPKSTKKSPTIMRFEVNAKKSQSYHSRPPHRLFGFLKGIFLGMVAWDCPLMETANMNRWYLWVRWIQLGVWTRLVYSNSGGQVTQGLSVGSSSWFSLGWRSWIIVTDLGMAFLSLPISLPISLPMSQWILTHAYSQYAPLVPKRLLLFPFQNIIMQLLINQ